MASARDPLGASRRDEAAAQLADCTAVTLNRFAACDYAADVDRRSNNG